MPTPQESIAFETAVSRVFRPAAPVDDKDLFAGRTDQMRQVIDAINQPGQHAIVYGERGVGKTSLANVMTRIFRESSLAIVSAHVNCDAGDNYSSLWRKVFQQIVVGEEVTRAGFGAKTETRRANLGAGPPENFTTDTVLRRLSLNKPVVVVVDEFDRLEDSTTRRMFADTIKALSDRAVSATVVMVGVADSVTELIEEHQSIERALVQIQMPRMSQEELAEIVTKGLERLKMAIQADAIGLISVLSRGLPHYTHLLSLHAARQAFDSGATEVSRVHVEAALKKSIDQAHESIKTAYHKATMSPRHNNLFGPVLLACALAQTDELGFFAAADVRDPLQKITKKGYDIPSFARHLKEFCEKSRGPVLQRIGDKHRYRFRFKNPTMQPYVILLGIREGVITTGLIETFESSL